MLKQFFFGSTDSPLFMFHHALGAVLIVIFTFLLIAVILSWFSSRRKKNQVVPSQKIIPEKKSEEIASVTPEVIIQEKEKPIEAVAPAIKEAETIIPKQESVPLIVEQPKTVTEEIEVYQESTCNTAEQLLHFTEIMLNKKLTEQDWDKRLPENILLDHRSYHQLIFQLIYLNADTALTTSRFKLVLETATEVAINHQIYFRNWVMPQQLTAAFKSGSTVTPDEKRIRAAVKIADAKSWKLQSSTSEQGTMINLLMKCAIAK